MQAISFKQLIMKYKFSLFFLSLFMFFSCKKDGGANEISLANKMIVDKIWYLSYSQIITGSKVAEKNYLGQSTYFIKFLSNNTSVDSDGLNGTYSIERIEDVLQLHVKAKTLSGNNVEYFYKVETLGAENMILYFSNATTINKFFYNTSH